jgi:fructose-1,6-bisphosphatase/inositol monophosphatase family enzyme
MSDEYLDFAKKLAKDAGQIMQEYFNVAKNYYKADNTIVTEADEKINQLVIDRVREKYPSHGVWGEEDSFNKDVTQLWVCDPVDGTAMFARGIPTAVFSLAYVVDGESLVGVVYDPFTDRLYSAVKGGGAFMNDEPIHVNEYKFGDKQEVSNFDLWPEAELKLSRMMDILNDRSSYFVGVGSVIQACMQVARGAFVSATFAGTKGKNVDIAAAKVIVEEAGGKVTNILGEDQRYDRDIYGAIISNGKVHDEIIAAFREDGITHNETVSDSVLP